MAWDKAGSASCSVTRKIPSFFFPSQQGCQTSRAGIFTEFYGHAGQAAAVRLEQCAGHLRDAQTTIPPQTATVWEEGSDDGVRNVRQGRERGRGHWLDRHVLIAAALDHDRGRDLVLKRLPWRGRAGSGVGAEQAPVVVCDMEERQMRVCSW